MDASTCNKRLESVGERRNKKMGKERPGGKTQTRGDGDLQFIGKLDTRVSNVISTLASIQLGAARVNRKVR